MKLFKKAKKGFTLVELVVVIAVIAILAAVSVGAYFGVTDSANKSRLEQEARQTYEGIRLISLADPENNQSLTIDGLSLDTSDDGVTEFTNDLVYATGQSYSVTLDEKPSAGIVGPTVVLLKNFYDTSVSSVSGSKENYKSFNYYTNHVTGYAANVNLINGKIEIISDEFEITPPVADTAVTGVALSDTSFPNFVTGNSVALTATVTPSTATNKAVRWESSNTSVITVNNGECRAVGAGDATVTVTTEEGGFTATCTFHVEDPYIAVTGISLDKQSETVYVDAEPVTLTATVTPADATDKTVIWASSNEAVATVSNGVVTFNAVGTATITASCGTFSTGCNFDVRPHAGTIVINSDDLNLHVGDEGSLTATVTPESAINKNYKWSSNNTAVVTIDENTGAYAAVGKGDAVVTATSTDNNEVKDTININVKKHVGSFSINGSENVKLELNGNNTITLETSFDSETSYGTSDIIWTVENGDAVTVNAGVVTAVKLGNATVRATVDGKTDAVNFTVVNIASGVSIDGNKTLRFNKDNEKRTLSAIVTPSDAEGSVAWESSNTNVVSIDETTGEYNLVGKGEATITATIGGHSDTVKIIVEVPVSGITFKVGNEQKDNVSLTKGQDSSQFVPVIANADETSYGLNGTWGVADSTVATVSNGIITAVKTGSTTVYYEIENRVDTSNNFRGSISVNVTNPATAIEISGPTSVEEGQTIQLSATITPNDADQQEVTWSSENSDIATVDNTGKVTGVSVGTVIIKATLVNTIYSNYEITVTEKINPNNFGRVLNISEIQDGDYLFFSYNNKAMSASSVINDISYNGGHVSYTDIQNYNNNGSVSLPENHDVAIVKAEKVTDVSLTNGKENVFAFKFESENKYFYSKGDQTTNNDTKLRLGQYIYGTACYEVIADETGAFLIKNTTAYANSEGTSMRCLGFRTSEDNFGSYTSNDKIHIYKRNYNFVEPELVSFALKASSENINVDGITTITLDSINPSYYTDLNLNFTYDESVFDEVSKTNNSITIKGKSVTNTPSKITATEENTSISCEIEVSVTEKTQEAIDEWVLIKNVEDLSTGDEIIIATNTKQVAVGNFSKDYFESTAITVSSDKEKIEDIKQANIFELGKNNSNWTLKSSDGSLVGTTGAKEMSLTSGTTTWTISISSGNATIKSTSNTYGWIQYNASSPRFSTYTSSQTAVQIYAHKTSESESGDSSTPVEPETPITFDSLEIDGNPKTSYVVGENFELNNSKILAKYSNNTTKDVTNNVNIIPNTNLQTTDTQVTITYTENQITHSISVQITVIENNGLNDIVTVEKKTFTAISGDLDTIVSYKCSKGAGTSNPQPNGGVIRLYQNSSGTGGGFITITVKEGYKLDSVTIGSSMGTSIAYTLGTSTTKSQSQSLAANGKCKISIAEPGDHKSISIYCMGTSSSSRLYVNYLAVTYSKL